jgi:hypothetical protein
MARDRLTLASDRDPWERQPRESPKQYARFEFYRDFGRLRTLTQVHKILTAAGDTLKHDSLRQIAYEYRWGDRAEAADLAQDQAERERLIIERRDMIKRHRNVATALLAKALTALQKIPIDAMAPADIVRYVKLATDIERTAIGEPQRIVAVTGPAGGPVQVEDISTLSPEERRTRLAEIAAELARRAGTDTEEDE